MDSMSSLGPDPTLDQAHSIVVLTLDALQDVERAFDLGANSFLVKRRRWSS